MYLTIEFLLTLKKPNGQRDRQTDKKAIVPFAFKTDRELIRR
jgi:hypothetical protein